MCLLSEGQRLYLHWSHKVNHTVHKHKHCHTALSFCASTCYTFINYIINCVFTSLLCFLSDWHRGDVGVLRHSHGHPVGSLEQRMEDSPPLAAGSSTLTDQPVNTGTIYIVFIKVILTLTLLPIACL